MAQQATVNVGVVGVDSCKVIYQSLDKYSFLDSVLVGGQPVAINVDVSGKYQFFRLILGNEKLPMILQAGESTSVLINAEDIWKSTISGSMESEYFLTLLIQYRKGGAESCKKIMRKNPDRIGNLFIADMLDVEKNLSIIKGVATRLRNSGIPLADALYNKVQNAEKAGH